MDMHTNNNDSIIESLTEISFPDILPNIEPEILAKKWNELIGSPIIPFDIDERQ
jgi:hypothetical protein